MDVPATSAMQTEAADAACVAARQLRGWPAVIAALGERLRALDPHLVLTCARGSSDHAATYAKHLIETRALVPVSSYSPSISSVYGASWSRMRGALFLVISQSGRSPDLLASGRAAKEGGATVVALVNDAASPLAGLADVTIPLLAGPELSVAATKSFVASLLAVANLVAAWSGDAGLREALSETPDVLARAWKLDWSPAIDALAGGRSLYVIGRGSLLGIAQEAALKLKETCAIHAEAFSAAEVQHGPMAIVENGFPVLMLVPQDAAGEAFAPLARAFVERGATVLVAGARVEGAIMLPTLPDLHAAVAPIAMIQSFYRLAPALSRARGRDPDTPPYLRKVTETR